MAVQFRVLGDIEVLLDGRLADVGHNRPRAVLAVLLAEANRVVAVDQLVDRVWGEARLPENPRAGLRTYISQLRQALAGADSVAIVRQPPGYKAMVDERCVDLHRFRHLLARARTAQDDDQAAALISEALGQWRGEPFAGLDTPWFNTTRQSLAVALQVARLDLTDIQLRLGRHTELLPDLVDRAAAYPLDERIAGQLVLALYRSGRQADALAHYRHIRRQLADELGTDPGASLQLVHQQILTADPTLAATTATPSRSPARPVVPRQLPAAPRPFTGRAHELARLTKALDEHAEATSTLAISAIGGIGGIGKTWLALHWAYQNLDRFPDGQLHVNLRGFDASGQPLEPAAVVRGFLDALGVEPEAIPPDLDAQAGLYRSLLAGKRMLIVADNARDTDQVIPLLPGSPTCTVLVTSRQQLGGLVTTHGASTIDLVAFAEPEARQVLARHLGHERVAAEPDAVAELLTCCAGLPLALSIAAACAARHPEFPLAALAAELHDRSRRLDALDTGDRQATLRAVLSWSTHALSLEAASGFGLLALPPGPDIGLPASASLLARPEAAARAVLRELENASLLQQYAPGRYRMHDLVRLYATDHAERDHTPAERDAALRRVLDFYTHTALGADRLLAPHRPLVRLSPPAPDTHPHPLPDVPAALAWFEVEHLNLLAAQQASATHYWHPTVWYLAWTLTTFHRRRAHRHDELAVWQAALGAAAHLPDPTTLTRAHRFVGDACADLGRHEEAIGHLHQALTLAEQHRDPDGQAQAHYGLAWAWARQGNDRQGLHHATRALELFRTLDQPVWEANALSNLGWYAARLGDYDTARTRCRAALNLHHRHHNPESEASTLDSLGYIEHQTGHHHLAIQLYQQALALFHSLSDTYETAQTLENLGHPHAALGQREHARTAWQQALELYQAQHRDTDAERVRQLLTALRPAPVP